MVTTRAAFDLAFPPTRRGWAHRHQLLGFPSSVQVHGFSEGRSREMDRAAVARTLSNQHIVTARAGPKMAAEGNGWAG